jgi:hypothetical protein
LTKTETEDQGEKERKEKRRDKKQPLSRKDTEETRNADAENIERS